MGSRATLTLAPVGSQFLLVDSRRLSGLPPLQVLEREQARAAVTARPYADDPGMAWAVEKKLGVCLDGWYVPLAVADAQVLMELEG
jgi:hypothetical protein